MTFDEAQAWADKHPECTGFTYEHPERYPSTKTRVWFKAKLEVSRPSTCPQGATSALKELQL